MTYWTIDCPNCGHEMAVFKQSPGNGRAETGPPTQAVAAPLPGPEQPPHPAEAVAAPFPTVNANDICPVHKVPWTYKEAGTNAKGVAYGGFWKCGEKDADGTFCKRRPALAWRPSQVPAA